MSMPIFKTKRVLKCSICEKLFDSEEELQAHQAEELAAASLANAKLLLAKEEGLIYTCMSYVLEFAHDIKDPYVMKSKVQEQLSSLSELQWCKTDVSNLTQLTDLIAKISIQITEFPKFANNTVKFEVKETLNLSLPSELFKLPSLTELLSAYVETDVNTNASSTHVDISINLSLTDPEQYLFDSQIQRELYQKTILAAINNRSATRTQLELDIDNLQKLIISLNEELSALKNIEQTLRNQVNEKKKEQTAIFQQTLQSAKSDVMSITI